VDTDRSAIEGSSVRHNVSKSEIAGDLSTPVSDNAQSASVAQTSRDGSPATDCPTNRLRAPGAVATPSTVDGAIGSLRLAAPEMSAGRRMWLWQYIASALVFGAGLGATLSAPEFAGLFGLIASAVIFATIAGFRLLLMAATIMPAHAPRTAPQRLLWDNELPTYSVLVPLFREAAVLPDLIDALSALDYPTAKLDIILILEACDSETQETASRLSLPPFMRVIVVPDAQPRTKPKALNAALAMTHSDLVAVYDAEDIPEPDQLRKAAAIFASDTRRLSCAQARLAIYNPRQSWLARGLIRQTPQEFHKVRAMSARHPDTPRYTDLMEEGTPHLGVVLDLAEPVELLELVAFFAAIAGQFDR